MQTDLSVCTEPFFNPVRGCRYGSRTGSSRNLRLSKLFHTVSNDTYKCLLPSQENTLRNPWSRFDCFNTWGRKIVGLPRGGRKPKKEKGNYKGKRNF